MNNGNAEVDVRVLAYRLERLRLQRDWTFKRLAAEMKKRDCDRHPDSWRQICAAARRPSRRTAHLIAQFLEACAESAPARAEAAQ